MAKKAKKKTAKKTAKKAARKPARKMMKKAAKKTAKKSAKKATKKAAKKVAKKASKKKARRTVMYSSKGKKLYAKRDAGGKFKDIQSYARAHAMDIKRSAAAEDAPAAPAPTPPAMG
jgi:hypothetical protein